MAADSVRRPPVLSKLTLQELARLRAYLELLQQSQNDRGLEDAIVSIVVVLAAAESLAANDGRWRGLAGHPEPQTRVR